MTLVEQQLHIGLSIRPSLEPKPNETPSQLWFVGGLLGQAMGLLYGQDWRRLRMDKTNPKT